MKDSMSRQNDNQPMKHFVARWKVFNAEQWSSGPLSSSDYYKSKVLHQNIDQASPDSIGTIWIDNINILSSALFLSIMEIWWTSFSWKFDTNTKVALWQLQKFYCPRQLLMNTFRKWKTGKISLIFPISEAIRLIYF